jgi:CRP-like cAMP-binding protein
MRPVVNNEALRLFRRHQHLAHGGQVQDSVYQIEEGWAYQYCVLPDGRRQITALFLPGDYCEAHWLLAGRAEYSIQALTDVKASEIALDTVHSRPGGVTKQLLAGVTQTLNRQAEWIVNLGRRSAAERLGSLFFELYQRLAAVDRVVANRCTIPLTQQDIADVVGLTPVHVNRVLSDMRRRGIVEFSGKALVVPNPEQLLQLAMA